MLSMTTLICCGPDELADGRLHLREVLLGALQARAGRGAHVQPHLPGIDLRKEVPAELREERQREQP